MQVCLPLIKLQLHECLLHVVPVAAACSRLCARTPTYNFFTRCICAPLAPGWAKDHASWRPTVVRRAFPQEGPRVKWAPAPQALLIDMCTIPKYLLHNFGWVRGWLRILAGASFPRPAHS